MRYFIVLIFTVLTTVTMHAQTYEIGGVVGGSNFIGDVGRTNFIAPNSLMFGGIAKWNRSDRHSFRLTVLTSKLEADDADSNEDRRNQRGFSFENSITEVSLGLEYTFWEFNMFSGNRVATPYLYTGLTYFWYDAQRNTPNGILPYDGAHDFAIPMVLGYKASVGTNNVIAFEIGARYTLTDAIDGSLPERGQPADITELHFGNLDNNDWYVFTGMTFTFTFGRKPCYCNF